ncbi:hypothetical protein H9L15_08740 [Sphingomonas daechungensis]|uniref:Uncharacterized protein n=2 Tax=Sphingomonas daechungensis TaxID=1176646 RepID=A0ABX6SXS9_9SPHN|nr:hypothetical protein [Sphingomonas daechungensis]QNP42401.1 hypothetical protein H9L15_08740 [Sphingomonas daechungensis]
MSVTGALIECDVPPRIATEIELVRGELCAAGSVMWRNSTECGVQFLKPIELAAWLPNAEAEPAANEPKAVPRPVRGGDHDPLGRLAPRIVEELDHVARLLDALGDELIGDPYVVARHGLPLQRLDRATQILGHLGAIILSDDPEQTVSAIGMEDLRRRLLRKSL